MLIAHRLSLSEKHSPEVLSQLFGQETIAATLFEQIKARAGRSVLLYGPSGCGKSTAARIYAAGLLCASGNDGFCKEVTCDSCRAMRRGEHYNFFMMRHGAIDDVAFAHEINSAVEVESFGYGGLVILIDQAHLMSARAFEILHERLARPPRGVTYILCVTDPLRVPKQTRDLLLPLKLAPPNIKSGTSFLSRILSLEGIYFTSDGVSQIVRFESSSFRALSRDAEVLLERGSGFGLEAVTQYYLGDEAAAYVDLVFRREGFEAQLACLARWTDEAPDQIRRILLYLTELFQMSVRDAVPLNGSLAVASFESRVSKGKLFLAHCDRLKEHPRALASRMLGIWGDGTAANRASLLRKASEFDELLGETHLLLGQSGVEGVTREWKAARKRTLALIEGERRAPVSGSRRSSHASDIYLADAEVRKLWESGSFLIQHYGVVFNTWIRIFHGRLQPIHTKTPGELTTELGRELRMRSRGPGEETTNLHWAYLHRFDDAVGVVTEIVAHLPNLRDSKTSWIRRSFFQRRNATELQDDAVIVRTYDRCGNRAYRRHLTLMRIMCGGAASNPPNRIFFQKAGIDVRRMVRPIGPRVTGQRMGVSRSLDHGAQHSASDDLQVLSSFSGGPFSSGWEFAEHRYRLSIASQKRALQHAIIQLYGGAEQARRLDAFLQSWSRARAQREIGRPGFHNFQI